jgi:hypothetical protein
MSKTTHCPDCKLDLTTKNFAIHLKSKKHLANSSKASIPENKIIKPQPQDDETDAEDDDDNLYDADDEDDNGGYLDDFDNFSTQAETSIKPPFQPPDEKLQRIIQQRHQPVAQYHNPYRRSSVGGGGGGGGGDNRSVKSDDIFSSKATPILGKSYRENLAKIRQYKQLFKSELKHFKVKKNASSKDLENYIVEMQTVLSTESADQFTTDAIYHVLGVVESASSNFRNYNLTGITEILKSNIQFNHLVKVLGAKYATFAAVEPEYIMAFTLASTAYIVMSQNRIKAKLNEPVVEPIKA